MAGSGPLEAKLKTLAAELGATNVEFVGQLDRDAYFELLQQSDVGVTTVAGDVSVPAYPSKIAGYTGMGLPILMAVDSSSDYGAQVEQAGAGIAVPAGDPGLLADAITRIEREFDTGALEQRRLASRKFYESTLSSDSAARRVLHEMGLV